MKIRYPEAPNGAALPCGIFDIDWLAKYNLRNPPGIPLISTLISEYQCCY